MNGRAWYDFYHSLSVAYIFFKKTFLLSILIANYDTNMYMFFNRKYRKLVRLDGSRERKANLQLFVQGPMKLTTMITTVKVDQMVVS